MHESYNFDFQEVEKIRKTLHNKDVMQTGDCVQIPDGRIGRVRDVQNNKIRVRVMHTTSKTHQFLFFSKAQLKVVACPMGWMSPQGYNRYLKITLEKMKKRVKQS